MMRSIVRVLVALVLALVMFAPAPASAGDLGITIQGEAEFLARYGKLVSVAAPHVYVLERGGETLRVAFGEEGWKHERPRVEKQLLEAQQALSRAQPSERPMLEEVVASLSAMLEEPAAARDDGAIHQMSETISGTYCGANYSLTLAPERLWSGNWYYPNPLLTLGWVEFGPPSPWTKDVILTTGIYSGGAYLDFDSLRHLFGGIDYGTTLSVESIGGPAFCWLSFTQARFYAYGSPTCPNGSVYVYRQYTPCP